jgi:thiaminase
MKQLVNSAAEAASEETRSEMRTVCRYSAELEYRFWDGAYQGEAWCL